MGPHGPKKWGSKGWGFDRWGAGGGPKGGRPKISSFFVPLPPQNSFFSSLSWGLLVEFWWCFETAVDQLWLEAGRFPVGTQRLANINGYLHRERLSVPDLATGALHDSPRTPNVHIFGSQPSKTPPKFNETTPKREKKRKKIVAGEKKRAKFGSPHPSGPTFSRFGPAPFGAQQFGPHPSGPHPSGPHLLHKPETVWWCRRGFTRQPESPNVHI